MAALARLGGRFIASGDAAYPALLRAIDAAPPLIALRGDPAILSRPAIAIVGSRNASAAGGVFTERLARTLGEAGLVIVSGLARGIDARAHHASLSTGTVAVMAGGHDRIYPANHAALVDAILDAGGAVLAEMPMGWQARSQDFPRRNRIVSGLSYGSVVVEAARRSGSLITARYALEQNREVFAVPGSPLDPRSDGTNDLIRQGATLVTEADHILEVIGPIIEHGAVPEAAPARRRPDLADQPDFWEELDFDGASAPVADTAPEPEPAEPGDEHSRIPRPARSWTGRDQRSRPRGAMRDPNGPDRPARVGTRRAYRTARQRNGGFGSRSVSRMKSPSLPGGRRGENARARRFGLRRPSGRHRRCCAWRWNTGTPCGPLAPDVRHPPCRGPAG